MFRRCCNRARRMLGAWACLPLPPSCVCIYIYISVGGSAIDFNDVVIVSLGRFEVDASTWNIFTDTRVTVTKDAHLLYTACTKQIRQTAACTTLRQVSCGTMNTALYILQQASHIATHSDDSSWQYVSFSVEAWIRSSFLFECPSPLRTPQCAPRSLFRVNNTPSCIVGLYFEFCLISPLDFPAVAFRAAQPNSPKSQHGEYAGGSQASGSGSERSIYLRQGNDALCVCLRMYADRIPFIRPVSPPPR